ncbi:MAG: hypothetical protein KGJ61_04660 [Candidatus Omnitrophica bacterium]|nr:hypothetical protein [Candidatus Omnitrophota bacterium]
MEEQVHAPIEYVRIFFRRKWFIIIPVFAGLVLGICAGMVLPKRYMSKTVIMVEESKSDNPLFQNLAVSSSVSQRMQNISESMLGWDSLVELVKRLHLDSHVRSPQEFEQLVLGIRKDISIKLRGNNIIELSYLGSTPIQAQAVVKNITDIFIHRNVTIQQQQTGDALTFIRQELNVYRGKIKSAEIAKLKDKLNTLLEDSTEKHPMVIQLRQEIKDKMAELRKENLQYTADDALNPDSTNALVSEIKKTLDTLQNKSAASAIQPSQNTDNSVYKVLLLDKLNDVVARDSHVNEQIYNELLQRLETAKITQRLEYSKEGTRYTIIDPPRVPFEPAKPNVLLVVLVSTVAGLACGIAFVFLTEFMDKSFLDVKEAATYLGRPLLGAICKITTQELIALEKENQKWLLFWMVSSGVFVVLVTGVISVILRL